MCVCGEDFQKYYRKNIESEGRPPFPCGWALINSKALKVITGLYEQVTDQRHINMSFVVVHCSVRLTL